MEFLPNHVDTDNVMLCDILYHRGTRGEVDTLDIIYKDLSTGEKFIESIDEPQFEIYFTKDSYRNYTYNKNAIPLNEVNKVQCAYRNVPWTIAKNDNSGEYKQLIQTAIETGSFNIINRVHQYPYVFGSDIPIETFYKTNWILEYDNDKQKTITKQFLDIEVDTIDYDGFPRDGRCPINAVTIVDAEELSVYTFLLNNKNNPQIKSFVSDIDDFIEELHKDFDEYYGELNYEIFIYNDELEMIGNVFGLIHTLKRDFMLIWNGFGFDIPYIIDRIKRLGADPADIMCHPDFRRQQCYFKKDVMNFSIPNKSDNLKLSSYTKYLDQMHLYAATRKGRSELRSYNLNYIARNEIGDEKLNYSDEADIKTLPYVDYRKFVKYNIKDTLLQYGIERRANDVDTLYLNAYKNCVDYDNAFKQTVALRGRFYYEFLINGYAIGNNINIFNATKGTYGGALVGDPLLNSNTGIEIFGKPSQFVYDNVIDFDFSSMYPFILITFNIERNTMIGKLIIPSVQADTYEHVFVNEIMSDVKDLEEYQDSKYDAGQDFVDNYLTGDVLSLGSKWFNLPSFDEIHDDFIKEFDLDDSDDYYYIGGTD